MELAERLVHVLAQLPDEMHLELPEHALAQTTAEAYGVAGRLRTTAAPPGAGAARFTNAGGSSPVEVGASDGGDLSLAECVAKLDPSGRGHEVPRGADGILAGHRVAIVTNVPAPYRLGLFSRLQERLDGAGGALRVFFSASTQAGRPWVTEEGIAFDHERLRSVTIPKGHRRPLLPMDLERRLAAFGPTIVLHGGLSPLTAPRAALAAHRFRAAFGIWSGEIPTAPSARGRLQTAYRRRLLSRADFVVSYGSLAGYYVREMSGAPLVIGRNSSALPPGGRARPLAPSPVELLTVGDMAGPGKGIDVLLEVMRRRPSLDCRLTVVGGGALLSDLSAAAAADPRVRFTGPLPHAEVQALMAGSDAYLTPTRLDRFGLALLEAMGTGLATVMSANPGARSDLAVPESNCLVVEGHDAASWSAAIDRICTDHELRRRLGESAGRTVRGRWTLDHAADAMVAGLRLGARSHAELRAGR